MAPATSGREREGDHLVFTQTVLSAMVHSEYGSGNVQVLRFWVQPDAGAVSRTPQCWGYGVVCGAGGRW